MFRKPCAGERLTELRESKGLSFGKFAETLGIHHMTVRRWESGKVELSRKNALKIAAIHNVSLDWLMSGKGEMKTNSILEPIIKLPAQSLTSKNTANIVLLPLLPLSAFNQSWLNTDIFLPFDNTWIQERIGIPHEYLFLIKINTDRMSPSLNFGQLVMLTTPAPIHGYEEGVWIFKIEDIIHLARLRQIAGMKYLAEYDNHSSLKPIPLDELPELIGKVVWSDTKW